MTPEKKLFVHPSTYHVWVDGSFRPPDAAACAYVIFSEKTKHIVKMARWAMRGKTINQMELMAINKALDRPNMDYVIFYCDSTYAISCLTLWRHAWEKRDWMTPLGEPVKNRELIEEIANKIDSKKFVRFVKVKAHSGDQYNSLVDHLASGLTAKMLQDDSIVTQEYVI